MSEQALKNATVFITGGAGFIGSYIADLAILGGASKVRVLDDFVRGSRANLAEATRSGRLELVEGDVCDAVLVDDLTAGADLVFHQAALRITHAATEPARAIDVMVRGTQNVIESAVRHRVAKVLAASSASVYGEPSYLPMDEAHPFNNRTLYGAAKIANEQMLRAYGEMFGLRYLMLRPFNVYGPRMDVFGAYTEVMIRWLERLEQGEPPVIFGDGLQTMDFIYVTDVARAYILAAGADATDVVMNAGTGTETSLRELCLLLCREAGRPGVEPVYQAARAVNGVTRRRASTELARTTIGFEAKVSLDEGLRDLVRWHGSIRSAPAGAAP